MGTGDIMPVRWALFPEGGGFSPSRGADIISWVHGALQTLRDLNILFRGGYAKTDQKLFR